MGLDSYLYRTSKRRVDAAKKFGEIRRVYSEDIDLLMKKPRWKNLFDSLPKNEDWKSYTDEQKKGVRYLRRAARRVAKKHGLALDRNYRPIFKFTVKDHDTYCDVPQTKIFRVKAVA